jgi:hypothetical protein
MVDLSRATLAAHSADMRQFIGFRESTLPDGQRIIDAYNSSGLALTLLPDRGLDIWTATYNGLPLTWQSMGSPHHADWARPWLDQFNGGLMTTCGLQHVGPPETDDITGKWRDIHGQYTRLKAFDIHSSGAWRDEAVYIASLTGSVAEAAMFGAQLRVNRTYALTLGDPAITVTDMITNYADDPAPLMLLYHCNVGYPLVREGATLHTPSAAVYPRDEPARAAFEDWPNYHAARPHHAEEVHFHHVKADSDGLSSAALLHEDFGLQITWDTRTAPYLTQWKNFRQGMYVCGIEPGNSVPDGQNASRANNRLPYLQPGETRTFTLTIRVLDGAADVAGCKAQMETLMLDGEPVTGCHLEDYA